MGTGLRLNRSCIPGTFYKMGPCRLAKEGARARTFPGATRGEWRKEETLLALNDESLPVKVLSMDRASSRDSGGASDSLSSLDVSRPVDWGTAAAHPLGSPG